jgi:CHAT domain-containing protein/tetratricopeptide (TPR) repeat protein
VQVNRLLQITFVIILSYYIPVIADDISPVLANEKEVDKEGSKPVLGDDYPQINCRLFSRQVNCITGNEIESTFIDDYPQRNLQNTQKNETAEDKVVRYLNDNGNKYESIGQYDRAKNYYQQALEVAKEIKNRQGESNALNNLGNIYQSLGQYKNAGDFYQRSLEIYKELGDVQGEGNILNNLGIVYRSLEQNDKAEKLYQQALQISERIGSKQGKVNALGNLGNVYRSLEKYEQAEKLYQQALQISEEIGDRRVKSKTLNNLGIVCQNLRQYDRAENYSQQALKIAKEIEDKEGESNALSNLGVINYKLRKLPTAIQYLQQAVSISDSLRVDLVSDEDKISLFATQIQSYKLLAASLNLTGDGANSLIATERGRTRAFNDLLSKRLADNPNLSSPITFQFSQLQAQAISRKSTIVSYSILPDLDADKFTNAPFKLLIHVLKPDGSLKVRESLIPRTTQLNQLIADSRSAIRQSGEYALRQQSGGSIILSQRGNSQPDINILKPRMKLRLKTDLATAPGRVVVAVNNNNRTVTLEAQVDGTPNTEEVSFTTVREVLPLTFAPETSYLKQLHQILIQPITDLLPTNSQSPVIFIPDGALYEVPFAALQDDRGHYLIERHTISLAPSLSVLVQTGRLQQRNLSPLSQSLVVGNPTLSKEYQPLPYSQTEAEQISKQLKSSVLLGRDATKAQVRLQIQTAPVIHLATHGGYNSNGGLNSSGVFLTASGDEDGFLSAAEVLDYKLQANLVVVSSCDSGRGQISGDGVLGLSRSFIARGASSTMVSLWSINDRSTADLMTAFYKYWQGGQSKSEALRQAMLEVKGKYDSPYFWAAMSLVGEP